MSRKRRALSQLRREDVDDDVVDRNPRPDDTIHGWGIQKASSAEIKKRRIVRARRGNSSVANQTAEPVPTPKVRSSAPESSWGSGAATVAGANSSSAESSTTWSAPVDATPNTAPTTEFKWDTSGGDSSTSTAEFKWDTSGGDSSTNTASTKEFAWPAPAPTPKAEAKKELKDGEWECKCCETINSATSVACTMCLVHKPGASVQVAFPATAVTDPQPQSPKSSNPFASLKLPSVSTEESKKSTPKAMPTQTPKPTLPPSKSPSQSQPQSQSQQNNPFAGLKLPSVNDPKPTAEPKKADNKPENEKAQQKDTNQQPDKAPQPTSGSNPFAGLKLPSVQKNK
eukprot:TRINITY_DN199_c0_g1_i1.p1 TRINITY_DN199_c0_g1~~TRINITY_DN199_c0_g1_i1.p1  ORF type:complete len:341 (+),score=64.34 TRINITY_DN199_c0_g1_i1:21-1043(+)